MTFELPFLKDKNSQIQEAIVRSDDIDKIYIYIFISILTKYDSDFSHEKVFLACFVFVF